MILQISEIFFRHFLYDTFIILENFIQEIFAFIVLMNHSLSTSKIEFLKPG